MKENNPHRLAPRLRFAQFRKAEWREVRLEQLGKLVGGLTYSPDDVRDNGLLVLRSSNILIGEIALDDCVFVRPDIEGANRTEPNDIVICVRNGSKALIGKNALIPEGMPPCTHGAFMTVFRSPSAHFVFQLFQTEAYQEQVAGHLGATINSINGSQLKRYQFAVPNKAEQKKIADCLTSLDELIAAQRRRVEAMKAHKKGLMQQLFPREGETLPRLRFPDVCGAGEWGVTTIGEHVDLLSGYPFDGHDIVGDSTGTRLMRGINITEGTIRHDPDIDRYYTGPTEGLERYRLREGDLVIGMDGSKVGKNSALVTAADAGALLVQRVARLRSDQQVTLRFIFHHVNSSKFHAYVDRINTSSGIPHISAKQINDFSFCLPVEEEQAAIDDCLSTLDARIAAEADKLAALRTHKKGLMQQLFPSPEGTKS